MPYMKENERKVESNNPIFPSEEMKQKRSLEHFNIKNILLMAWQTQAFDQVLNTPSQL